jgi:hypothetical protein
VRRRRPPVSSSSRAHPARESPQGAGCSRTNPQTDRPTWPAVESVHQSTSLATEVLDQRGSERSRDLGTGLGVGRVETVPRNAGALRPRASRRTPRSRQLKRYRSSDCGRHTALNPDQASPRGSVS